MNFAEERTVHKKWIVDAAAIQTSYFSKIRISRRTPHGSVKIENMAGVQRMNIMSDNLSNDRMQ
jgi:hypothetical protein